MIDPTRFAPILSFDMFLFPLALIVLSGFLYVYWGSRSVLSKSLALLFLFCAGISSFGQTLPNLGDPISCTIEPDEELEFLWQQYSQPNHR
ncbi:MAG TPA: hypothetical protein VFS39_04680 [Nitrospira sp.]|nr:hypothetical protein [Nitrospira sp.]